MDSNNGSPGKAKLSVVGLGRDKGCVYAWKTYRTEWQDRQGARSCWVVWDTAPVHQPSRYLRADNLGEVRETMEGMDLEKFHALRTL